MWDKRKKQAKVEAPEPKRPSGNLVTELTGLQKMAQKRREEEKKICGLCIIQAVYGPEDAVAEWERMTTSHASAPSIPQQLNGAVASSAMPLTPPASGTSSTTTSTTAHGNNQMSPANVEEDRREPPRIPAGLTDVTDALMYKVRDSVLMISGRAPKSSLIGFPSPTGSGTGPCTLGIRYRFGTTEITHSFGDEEIVRLP